LTGGLAVCATPIGNLGDITLRVLDTLRAADVLACEDTRHSRVLLARYELHPRLVSLHEHNEAVRTPELLARVAAGEHVALVSDAGMPGVSDPGARLVAAALAAGLPVTVLPGPSAVTTAIVASGLAGSAPEPGFAFAGFLPRGATALAAALDRVDAARLPVVAFESPRRLPATLAALAARAPDRLAAVCRELTKVHEEVRRGTLAELADAFAEPSRGEITLVLAAAAEAAPADAPPAEALAELADAVGARRAAALASRLTGVPRNRLYRLLTEKGAH
jgi:16S rRNA (cytidine1402-2'-O)-methyltransferase